MAQRQRGLLIGNTVAVGFNKGVPAMRQAREEIQMVGMGVSIEVDINAREAMHRCVWQVNNNGNRVWCYQTPTNALGYGCLRISHVVCCLATRRCEIDVYGILKCEGVRQNIVPGMLIASSGGWFRHGTMTYRDDNHEMPD